MRRVHRPVALRQQQVDRPADHFLRPIAEYLFSPGIEQGDCVRLVDSHNRILGDLHYPAEFGVRLSQLGSRSARRRCNDPDETGGESKRNVERHRVNRTTLRGVVLQHTHDRKTEQHGRQTGTPASEPTADRNCRQKSKEERLLAGRSHNQREQQCIHATAYSQAVSQHRPFQDGQEIKGEAPRWRHVLF